MKSALQIQLDNQYELLRVAYLKRKEQTAAPVRTLQTRALLHRPLKNVPSKQVQQSANWDAAWFNHYE